MEKVSTSRDRWGLGLINIKERIQAIHAQALEYLQADQQFPETDNVLFEVGLHQKTLYGRVIVKEANAIKLLPIRGSIECKLCSGVEYDIKHILFECTALTRVQRHVQDWFSNFNINNFNRETIIEMKNIKNVPNYIISLYKDTGKKNRRLAQLRDINEQAVRNSLDSNLRFYITHILKVLNCHSFKTKTESSLLFRYNSMIISPCPKSRAGGYCNEWNNE